MIWTKTFCRIFDRGWRILEQLSEQLVELENDPQNKDLLNAIFRGFHTVKGGAGFLSLGALVDTCHGAENVFDTLRNGQRTVTSDLMDVILQSLDTINTQFAQVRAKEEPEAASLELLELLHKLSEPESEDEAPIEVPKDEPAEETDPNQNLQQKKAAATALMKFRTMSSKRYWMSCMVKAKVPEKKISQRRPSPR